MHSAASAPPSRRGTEPTPGLPIGLLTFLLSLGTGILWNALFFIAKSQYGFDEAKSLWLAFGMGVLYTVVAFNAGRTVRALERRVSPRATLGLLLLVQAALAPLVLIPNEIVLWITAIVMTGFGALQWPIVQHYLVSGRHGPEMRNAIGWWNASWMASTAVGLAVAGPLERYGLAAWAIPAMLPVNLLAFACLAWFPAQPPAHDAELHARHVPPSYGPLLRAARVLHPLGYLVIGALAPILPYLFTNLHTSESLQAPIGSTWHVARLLAVLILWKTAFWHGRGATLVVAGGLLSLGFATAVMAPSEGVLMIALVAVGLGQGTIYYNAIYYGLAVGAAEVDAGGIHEALVGAGYFMGPAIGLATLAAGAGTPVFIGIMLGALAVGSAFALLRARSQSIA